MAEADVIDDPKVDAAPKVEADAAVQDKPATDAAPPAPQWREDWRSALAGDNPKELKRLERMKGPEDIYKSYRALEQKISSGELKAPVTLPDNPTEEQIAEYRAAQGIPDKPDAYLDMGNGVVVGEDDKPVALSLATALHEANLPPKAMAVAYDWYQKVQEQIAENDKANRQSFEDELRVEWESDYRGNMNSVKSFMDTIPGDGATSFFDMVMGSRDATGRRLGDNPAAIKAFHHLANEMNPAGFTMPGSGMGQVDGLKEEKAKIEAQMGTQAYIKNEAMQERYRKVVDALIKIEGKA